MGIRIMKYRARMIGATLLLESAPGGGAEVTCQFPMGSEAKPVLADSQTSVCAAPAML
jgi:nitrate/nitrite-specific signal transduction histidine kinase